MTSFAPDRTDSELITSPFRLDPVKFPKRPVTRESGIDISCPIVYNANETQKRENDNEEAGVRARRGDAPLDPAGHDHDLQVSVNFQQ